MKITNYKLFCEGLDSYLKAKSDLTKAESELILDVKDMFSYITTKFNVLLEKTLRHKRIVTTTNNSLPTIIIEFVIESKDENIDILNEINNSVGRFLKSYPEYDKLINYLVMVSHSGWDGREYKFDNFDDFKNLIDSTPNKRRFNIEIVFN